MLGRAEYAALGEARALDRPPLQLEGRQLTDIIGTAWLPNGLTGYPMD